MTPPSTQTSLLRRVRDAGDAGAWAEFDRLYGPMVVGYCLRRGLQISDAEDIRQVVMMGLARALVTFEYEPERGRFRDYVGRAAAHAVARHGRGPINRIGTDDLAQIAASSSGEPDTAWRREWVIQHCRAAVGQLRATESAQHLEVFDRLIAGQNATQIGEALGMTPEAVRKLKQRLRDRLRAMIAARIGDEENAFG